MSRKKRKEMIAYVWTDPTSGLFTVKAPYAWGFVEQVKNEVPGNCREWNPEPKTWTFEPQYERAVMRIANLYYPEIVDHMVSGGDGGADGSRSGDDDDVEVDVDPYGELLRLGSTETKRKVYRLVAGDCHPDRAGGGTEKMAKVNEAWDQIKKKEPGLD